MPWAYDDILGEKYYEYTEEEKDEMYHNGEWNRLIELGKQENDRFQRRREKRKVEIQKTKDIEIQKKREEIEIQKRKDIILFKFWFWFGVWMVYRFTF